MTSRCLAVVGLSAAACVAFSSIVRAQHDPDKHDMPVGLVKAVQDATRGCGSR